MDKITKCLFAFALLIVTLTGCRDEAELSPSGTPGHPEQEVVGTFSGTWTVDIDGNVSTYPGTLSFEAGSDAYITKVTAICEDTKLDRTSVANIVKNSAGYRFYNELPGNEIGAAFSGYIDNQGVASINFKIVQRSGKKNVLYTYAFSGTK